MAIPIGSTNKCRRTTVMFDRRFLTAILLLFVAVMYCSSAQGSAGIQSFSDKELEELVEREYDAYQKIRSEMRDSVRGIMEPEVLRHLQNISRLPPQALPFIIKKLEETGDATLAMPLGRISRKFFYESEIPKDSLRDSKAHAALHLYWWREGHKKTGEYFDRYYKEWCDLRAQGKEEEAKEALRLAMFVGIAGLPYMTREVGKGDAELIPAISKLVSGRLDPNATTQECLAWWEANEQKWLIAFPEEKPPMLTLIVAAIGIVGVAAGLILVLRIRRHQREAKGLQNPKVFG
jgi:hypothetical protein